ncbi:MAG: type III pantothenate kinase [Muribaculaceae bacterium]|nr:type III pantothenate kinase [Muribaculaceae bacterium]
MKENGRFLAVDQGNSLLKLTLIDDGWVKETARFSADAMEDVFSVVERWNPRCGAFCSVGKIDSRMVESLRIALDGRLLVMSRSTCLPIEVDYATPDTLGLDRIALAAGAAMLYPGRTVMVVDAGTAVTLDVVDRKPAFKGGRITAGMRLRFESLHSHTSALPSVDPYGPCPMLGDSTVSSIRSGVIMGLADEIVETFRRFKENFGCVRLVLTGGDAGLIFDCINSRIPADHVSGLMAQGLLYIYNHNEI